MGHDFNYKEAFNSLRLKYSKADIGSRITTPRLVASSIMVTMAPFSWLEWLGTQQAPLPRRGDVAVALQQASTFLAPP